MRDLRFTSSIITAIDFALSLAQGKLSEFHDIEIESPRVGNFRFWGKITATDNERIKRMKDIDDREYAWLVHRTVNFWFLNKVVCQVFVEGIRPDQTENRNAAMVEKLSSWAVIQVRYAKDFTNPAFCEWRFHKFPVTAYSSQST